MSRRTERVEALMLEELGRLLLTKLKDPRVGFVTVTKVEASMDLKSARVYYSVMGSGKEKADTQAALEHATGFLQREVAQALKLRYAPKLLFRLDESLDEAMRIDKIIRDIHQAERRS